MKPAEYWKKRSEQVAQLQYDKADEYEVSLRREYDRAMQSIQQSVEVFYQRYAMNNEINLAETRKLLTGKDLKEFKMTLEEFTAKAKDNADGRWTQQLNNVYYRTRISRLEALQVQIRHHVEMLAASRQDDTRSLLSGLYKDTYYRNIYEIQAGTGFGVSFAKLNEQGIEVALSAEYAGSNWSKRIWGDRDKLAGELRTKLTQSFIRGDSIDRTVRDLRERMGVSQSNAERLVQSESAFFTGQATMAGYKASGIVQKYEILATLDRRTSDICRGMDGKVFSLSEMEVSVNYPPFHARCRTTTMAAFEDEADPGERIARDEEGQSYYVPGDISYQQWYDKHVNQTLQDPQFISNVRTDYNSWDKQNGEEFASNLLSQAGSHLQVQKHVISAHGQCVMDPSGTKLIVNSYELNANDSRSTQYQVKTAFHELFHAMSNGLQHDIHTVGFKNWAYCDDVFAESFSHYMVKTIGIADEIAPSYPGYLVETLPKLKTLPEFKQSNTISDFGKIAYEYRMGAKPNAEWSNLFKTIDAMPFDLAKYSQSYLGYIQNHSGELIDKMLENMPGYTAYRSQMINDVDSAIQKGVTQLLPNEKLIFENILILTMNRLGVNEL